MARLARGGKTTVGASRRFFRRSRVSSAAIVFAIIAVPLARAAADTVPLTATQNLPTAQITAVATPDDHKKMLMQYCTACHNDRLKTAGMSVVPLDANNLRANQATWEKILRRVSLGEMPLRGAPRPPKERLQEFTAWLARSLDDDAAAHPNPGHATMRRLNRAEYTNAIRDLLALDVDFSKELPVDDTGYGFDNIADVLTLSPTLMDRYINVAGKVSRLATGLAYDKPSSYDYKIPKDVFQNRFGVASYNERASDDLPLNSRGGGAFKYYAPYDATYKLGIFLNSGTSTELEIDAHNLVEVKVALKAGLRTIGVSFPKKLALDEELVPRTTNGPLPRTPPKAVPIPLDVSVDGARVQEVAVPSVPQGPNVSQSFYLRDVKQITVAGPYGITGAGDTASLRKVFICRPSKGLSEAACARTILTNLAHHAYRRPVTAQDVAPLMKMYAIGRKGSDFHHGIEAAVEGVLVSPNFLFAHELDAPKTANSVHRISGTELATRMSLFLWSSIPDDELLSLAEKNQLGRPEVLKAQVARMLADPKAKALTENFAGQWLYLRRLEYQKPDRLAFPGFDQRLRQAMQTETEMFFDGVVRDNRPVLDFLDADYTYVNQRLAEHYGIPNVYGTTFRKVKLDPALHRSGLLGQGAILTVTSYNNRTSVVLRGKWILENLLAAAPPPPPPLVPSLDDAKNGKTMTVREQMEMHRKNPVCASCHTKMDPLGFSLENYDAVGGWRTGYAGQLVDASAVLPDGTKFEGPKGLQDILLARKDQFVEALTERLMTYALARGLESYDMPAVRSVRYQAAKDGYRMQSIILGIIQSVPFTMRRTPET
jgi:mono/diheme cytochrome c family protein